MRLLIQLLFLVLPIESRYVGEHPSQMVGLPAVQQQPRDAVQTPATNSPTSASVTATVVDSRAGDLTQASFAGTSSNSQGPCSSIRSPN